MEKHPFGAGDSGAHVIEECSCYSTPSSLQSYIRSTCLVPFLYHTPTLSSQPLQAQSCKKGRSSGMVGEDVSTKRKWGDLDGEIENLEKERKILV